MKSITLSVPEGYKGIRNEINFKFNGNLAVITGLNGAGKTTILKFLCENHENRNRVFFKTQSSVKHHRLTLFQKNRLVQRNADNLSFDDVMDYIHDAFLRFFKQQDYIHEYELYQMLFDENSYLYDEGYDFLPKIVEILSSFEDSEAIRKQLGLVTQSDREESIKRKISEITKSDKNPFPFKQPSRVYTQYLKKLLSPKQQTLIDELSSQCENELKQECRRKASIKDKQSLENYIYDLVSKAVIRVDSIITKLSQRIYEDARANNNRTKTRKLWEKINEELSNYDEFKYRIVKPSLFSSRYEISFEMEEKEAKTLVHFDSLSSGEKVIFELVCYYFMADNIKGLELVILDEFDANLNPALAESYLKTVRKQFCDKGVTAILTTHSPSTVAEVEPGELYEISVNKDQHELTCAENADGKKKILKKLAPKFVYYSEFGNLEYILNTRADTIILVEGKFDEKNFKTHTNYNNYTFIACGGKGNIKNFLVCLEAIPFLKNIVKDKLIIGLFDFDLAGRDGIKNIVDTVIDDELALKIKNKESPFVSHKNNVYLAMFKPKDQDSWEYKSKYYRHQELKTDGVEGLNRQYGMLKEIESKYILDQKTQNL